MCLHSSQVTKAMYARIQARDLLVVVGSGKAAIDILQGLQPSARVLWAHRGHTAFMNRQVIEAQFESNGEDFYRSLASYAERGVMTKEHWSISAFRDGWLISCHGQMTRRAVITGGGVCSLAELAHANGFSQMDLGDMYVSAGGELVLAPREGSDQSGVTLRANDAVILCTGKRNNSFEMPTLSARFARSGPYTLNSGALTALVPLRVALEQIYADETGSGETEVPCALQAEIMCKASVAAVLAKPDKDPRGLELSLGAALLPVMCTVLPGVKVDVAYLKEWIEEWYGRDVNVIDAMARLTGGGAKLSSRSQSGLKMGRVFNVEAATPVSLETVLALVARTAGGAVDADAMQLMEAARRIAAVARTRRPSRLAASHEATTLITGKELAASHRPCTTADGGSAVETACQILTEVSGSTVDPSTKYESLGLTSMQTVEFRDKLCEALGVEELPMEGLALAEGTMDEVIGKLKFGLPTSEEVTRDDRADLSPASSSFHNSASRPLLVLHGKAGDGALMRRILELTGWLAELRAHGFEVEFLDAPHAVSPAPELFASLAAAGEYNRASYFAWESATVDEAGRAAAVCESVRHVERWIEQHAPISGICGISDGALIAAAVAARSPSLQFFINFCSTPWERLPTSTDLEVPQLITVPSLHVLGRADELLSAAQLLSVPSRCDNMTMLWHKGGHVVPLLDGAVAEALRCFLGAGVGADSVPQEGMVRALRQHPTKVPSHDTVSIAAPSVSVSLETVLALAARTAGGPVDADAPLLEAGLDSLGAVELRNQLQQALGEGAPALPSTLVFDHPTARELVQFVTSRAPPDTSLPSRSTFASPAPPLVSGADGGTAVQQLLVVQLPGLDGSLFHFRALDGWLALEQMRTHAISIDSFDGDFEAWVRSEAARATAAAHSGERLVLLGYSAGGTLVQAFHQQLEACGCPVAALVLMDPALASADNQGVRPEASRASIASSFMATSVMDEVPTDLDAERVRRAMLDIFPSYHRRFDAIDKMQRIMEGCVLHAAPHDGPCLLLLSTDSDPVFDGLAGGALAEVHTTNPHHTIGYIRVGVDADHVVRSMRVCVHRVCIACTASARLAGVLCAALPVRTRATRARQLAHHHPFPSRHRPCGGPISHRGSGRAAATRRASAWPRPLRRDAACNGRHAAGLPQVVGRQVRWRRLPPAARCCYGPHWRRWSSR